MDSEDSSSGKISGNPDETTETNSTCNGSLGQSEVKETVKLFSSTPSQSSSFVQSNAIKTKHVNPKLNNQSLQKSNGVNDNKHDGSKITFSTASSSYSSNKVSSNSELLDSITPSRTCNITTRAPDSSQDVPMDGGIVDILDNALSGPSTSGIANSHDKVDNIHKECRKRPSSLKVNSSDSDDDTSCESSDDDYSLGSQDGCVYTYRGGEHLADLPSSFFSLDMGVPLDVYFPSLVKYKPQPNQNRVYNSRLSSPDMDFLEMDFDPEPSCEVDSGEEASMDEEMDNCEDSPQCKQPRARNLELPQGIRPRSVGLVSANYNMPSTSSSSKMASGDSSERHQSYGPSESYGSYITHINNDGEQLPVRRTMSHWPMTLPTTVHNSSGELVTPKDMQKYEQEISTILKDNHNDRTTLGMNPQNVYHHILAEKLLPEKTVSDTEGNCNDLLIRDTAAQPSTSTTGVLCVDPPERIVWSELEAIERQVTQIATSACGATAVINVFKALGVPVNVEKVNSAVGTRQRANNAPIPRYLFSRAVAGCTAADLVTGINRASDGLATARFFPTYPERIVSLSHWLADWISLGAVPILTLNLQAGCEAEIPDAWHHQMVCGVSPAGVSLCNPLERVREAALWPRLCSPSTLLVRAVDVLARLGDVDDLDLTPLITVPDTRFHTYNVLGQVVNLIREWIESGRDPNIKNTHIRIPAAYEAGITVAALTGSEAHRRLMLAPQLPILSPEIDKT